MVTKADYPDKEVQACISVLLELMTVLGEFRENIVLVGGNVPLLLIKGASKKHIGSTDIDIAFNLQNITEDTYSTILTTLKKAGYYQKEGKDSPPFKFLRDILDSDGKPVTIEIDLLAGEYGGTGKGHRTQKIQDIKARKARGCDLVFEDAVIVTLDGTLPDGAKNSVPMKIANIGPFLVTKGMALYDRAKEKDAYDIYYCCKYYPGGIEKIIEVIKPILSNNLVLEGLGKIKAKFKEVNFVGTNWVADFLELEKESEEREIIKREAFELVNTFLDKLGIEVFTE